MSRLTELADVIVHWWRLVMEPSGRGCAFFNQPKRWQVNYFDGGVSHPMAYDVACDYAEMFGGTVVRAKETK